MSCTPTALPLNAVAACVVPDIATAAVAIAGLVLVVVLLLPVPAAITLTTFPVDTRTSAFVVFIDATEDEVGAAFSAEVASGIAGDMAMFEVEGCSFSYRFSANFGLTCDTNGTSC